VLLERAAYLRKLAKHGDGSASETLKEYRDIARCFCFAAATARPRCMRTSPMFLRAGWPRDAGDRRRGYGARLTGPGEMRGSSVEGGARQELRAAMWRTCRRACLTKCW